MSLGFVLEILIGSYMLSSNVLAFREYVHMRACVCMCVHVYTYVIYIVYVYIYTATNMFYVCSI